MANIPPKRHNQDMFDAFRQAILATPNLANGYPLGDIASLIGHANQNGDIFNLDTLGSFMPEPEDIPLINQAGIPLGKDPIAQIDKRIIQDYQTTIVRLEQNVRHWQNKATENYKIAYDHAHKRQLAEKELEGLYDLCAEYEAQIKQLKATIHALQSMDQIAIVKRRIVQ